MDSCRGHRIKVDKYIDFNQLDKKIKARMKYKKYDSRCGNTMVIKRTNV